MFLLWNSSFGCINPFFFKRSNPTTDDKISTVVAISSSNVSNVTLISASLVLLHMITLQSAFSITILTLVL